MVKVNDKLLNREQFREWVQTARIKAERKKEIEARKNRKSLLKSHCTIGSH
jgi:hypothetical protein